LTPRAQLVTGTLFALLAGLMWGLVFVAPLLLPRDIMDRPYHAPPPAKPDPELDVALRPA
jgi:hypothetical protein